MSTDKYSQKIVRLRYIITALLIIIFYFNAYLVIDTAVTNYKVRSATKKLIEINEKAELLNQENVELDQQTKKIYELIEKNEKRNLELIDRYHERLDRSQ